jgi:hypothetical protein
MGICIRVDKEFYDLVQKFIEEFAEQNNLDISFAEATKIIAKKIENQGGLEV